MQSKMIGYNELANNKSAQCCVCRLNLVRHFMIGEATIQNDTLSFCFFLFFYSINVVVVDKMMYVCVCYMSECYISIRVRELYFKCMKVMEKNL